MTCAAAATTCRWIGQFAVSLRTAQQLGTSAVGSFLAASSTSTTSTYDSSLFSRRGAQLAQLAAGFAAVRTALRPHVSFSCSLPSPSPNAPCSHQFRADTAVATAPHSPLSPPTQPPLSAASVVERDVSCRFVPFRDVSCRFATFRAVSRRFVPFRDVSCRFATFRAVSCRFATSRAVSRRFVPFRRRHQRRRPL